VVPIRGTKDEDRRRNVSQFDFFVTASRFLAIDRNLEPIWVSIEPDGSKNIFA
jgi:hypothetical protein